MQWDMILCSLTKDTRDLIAEFILVSDFTSPFLQDRRKILIFNDGETMVFCCEPAARVHFI